MTSEQIDALWDFDDPAKSYIKFEEALKASPESADELHTQICRTLGLQRKFDEGWKELAKISLKHSPIVEVRVALESGRLKNSSGDKQGAIPYFEKSVNLAQKGGFDFYAVDAAHMMGIATKGAASLEWNEKAIAMAEASKDKRAQDWKGSLLNNTGWTYHDMGQFEKALGLFERALEFRKTQGKMDDIRIATWCVGRCLRSLKRYDEALAIQRGLEGGPEQGYVSEELGELLLVTGHVEESKPYFRKAYEMLAKDIFLKANEAPRLERLKHLGD